MQAPEHTCGCWGHGAWRCPGRCIHHSPSYFTTSGIGSHGAYASESLFSRRPHGRLGLAQEETPSVVSEEVANDSSSKPIRVFTKYTPFFFFFYYRLKNNRLYGPPRTAPTVAQDVTWRGWGVGRARAGAQAARLALARVRAGTRITGIISSKKKKAKRNHNATPAGQTVYLAIDYL